MIEQPLVSVIINCYNSEKYLRETIDSLIAQTYTNWEAIFWDNCSTDKTVDIIKSYEEPRFRYYLADNYTPLGEARNLAIEKVQGEYLCFLDSDDIWNPLFLKRAIDVFFQTKNIVCFFANYFDWRCDGKRMHNTRRDSGICTFKDMVRNYGVGMSSAVLKSDLVVCKGVRFNNNYQLVEDLDFFLKCSKLGLFYYDATPLNLYRIHSTSFSYVLLGEWEKEYEQIYTELKKEFVSKGNNVLDEDDILWLKNRSIACKLEYLMMNNKKKELFITLLSNKSIPIRYWSRLLVVFGGRGLFLRMKKIKEKIL